MLNPSPAPSVRCTLLCVNISTLLAVQPFAGFSLYCSSRAARELLFIRVLVAEECRTGSDVGSGESSGGEASSSSPSRAPCAASGGWCVRALSYAPGPLDTEMIRECREAADPVVRAGFVDLLQSGRVLRPEDSARRLLQLIHDDRFTDGAHIKFRSSALTYLIVVTCYYHSFNYCVSISVHQWFSNYGTRAICGTLTKKLWHFAFIFTWHS